MSWPKKLLRWFNERTCQSCNRKTTSKMLRIGKLTICENCASEMYDGLHETFTGRKTAP